MRPVSPRGVAPPTPTPRPHHATHPRGQLRRAGPRRGPGEAAGSTPRHGPRDQRRGATTKNCRICGSFHQAESAWGIGSPPPAATPRGRAPATPGVLQLVAQQPVAKLHPPHQNCRATDKACVPQHAPETAISPLPLSADAGLRYSGPFAKTDGHPSVQSRERQNETSTVFIPGNYGR